MSEPELYMELWADEDGDRYPVGPFGCGVSLGSYTVTVDDLMRLRPWLNGQDAWPQYAIQARWDNFADDEDEYETEAELASWPEARQRALLTHFLTDWVQHAECDPQAVLDVIRHDVNACLPKWARVFENGEGLWGDCLELNLAEGHTLEELDVWLRSSSDASDDGHQKEPNP